MLTTSVDRLLYLSKMELFLDRQLDSLEKELTLTQRKVVVLHALEAKPSHVQLMTSREDTLKRLATRLKPILRSVSKKKQRQIRLCHSQWLAQKQTNNPMFKETHDPCLDFQCPIHFKDLHVSHLTCPSSQHALDHNLCEPASHPGEHCSPTCYSYSNSQSKSTTLARGTSQSQSTLASRYLPRDRQRNSSRRKAQRLKDRALRRIRLGHVCGKGSRLYQNIPHWFRQCVDEIPAKKVNDVVNPLVNDSDFCNELQDTFVHNEIEKENHIPFHGGGIRILPEKGKDEESSSVQFSLERLKTHSTHQNMVVGNSGLGSQGRPSILHAGSENIDTLKTND